MEPLQTLYDASEAETATKPRLPQQLEQLYGGGLAVPRPSLYANFVTSLDGVVALDPSSAPYVISGRNEGDRFVMGLLRAFADTVLIAAGTMRADKGHLWTPSYICPPAKDAYRELRAGMGLAAEPTLAVVTGSGELDPAERAFSQPCLILTTEGGASRLAGRMPANARVIPLGDGHRIEPAAIVAALHREGLGTILTEGGPNLIGELLGRHLLDELFLTLSPVLAGRSRTSSNQRLGLVEGVELEPERMAWGRLLSVKRQAGHLFLRYSLSGSRSRNRATT